MATSSEEGDRKPRWQWCYSKYILAFTSVFPSSFQMNLYFHVSCVIKMLKMENSIHFPRDSNKTILFLKTDKKQENSMFQSHNSTQPVAF